MEQTIRNHSMAASKDSADTSVRATCGTIARVAAIHAICLGMLFIFIATVTLGSVSLLIRYWNEHRAALVVTIMIALVTIPGLVGELFQRK